LIKNLEYRICIEIVKQLKYKLTSIGKESKE
jgi:hypothetical protein